MPFANYCGPHSLSDDDKRAVHLAARAEAAEKEVKRLKAALEAIYYGKQPVAEICRAALRGSAPTEAPKPIEPIETKAIEPIATPDARALAIEALEASAKLISGLRQAADSCRVLAITHLHPATERAMDELLAAPEPEIDRALEALRALPLTPGPKPERMFPIAGGPSLPWRLIAPYDLQAQKNHSQSLEVLASRGGMDPSEAVAVLTSKHWRDCASATSEDLRKLIAEREAPAIDALKVAELVREACVKVAGECSDQGDRHEDVLRRIDLPALLRGGR